MSVGTISFMNVVIWQKSISNVYILYSMLYHSLKVTIHLIAIWKWCQHDFMKTMKPHRFWVNLSGLKANWIGFSYLSTSILCTTQIFQVHCTLAQLPTVPNTFVRLMPRMYIKRNVTWTNKSSCPRGGPSTKKVTQWLKFFEKCINWMQEVAMDWLTWG